MTWTDIQIETLKDYTPLPHRTIPCLPLSFWKNYKAEPDLHHISDMSRYLFGDIPVPPKNLRVLNELEQQVKLVRCRLVIYVHIEAPENLDWDRKNPYMPYADVEGYPFPSAVQAPQCPEQFYLELPELERQEPDPRKLERVYSDEDLSKPPPRMRGVLGNPIIWQKVWKFYKWLFDSALYYIPFYTVALGIPLMFARVIYRLLSLGADEEVGWWFLPNIWDLLCSWRDVLYSYLFGILGWLGILKLYDLVTTALRTFFGPWFETFAHGKDLALHSVTNSTEYISGLYNSTAGYVVSTRIWKSQLVEWKILVDFLGYFIPLAIILLLAHRGLGEVAGPLPWYIRPLVIVSLICQSLWLESVRSVLTSFAGYVLDVPKIVMGMFEGLLHLPETFKWILKWISEIGGDTSVSIIPEIDPSPPGISMTPEPEPGAYDDAPQPFKLSPNAEKTLSESTLGEALTGSKLGEAILILDLSKEQGLSGIAEMLEQSELGRTLGEFGLEQSLVGGEPIEQSLQGSLLGYILTGTDTEKMLVTAQLGATLAKSDFAEMFVGPEIAETLTQSELADLITEALNTELGLEIIGSGLKGHAKEIPSVPILGKVLSGLNLGEALDGSMLGKISTGSTSGPILPIDALTSWEDLAPPEPYIPGTLVIGIEMEPAPPLITKIMTIVMKPIMTLLSPFQIIVTRIVSVLKKVPIIESLLPMATRVANTALKPLAPVIGFLGGFSSTTEQPSDQKPQTGAPIAESILPIIAKVFTIILKPVASLVARFSDSTFADSPMAYLKLSFDPAKVSLFISWIIFPLSVTVLYIIIRRYLDAWNQPNPEPPGPRQGLNLLLPLRKIRDLFVYVYRKLRLAFHLFRRFLGAVGRLFAYLFRPFAFLLCPFRWLYTLVAMVLRPLITWLGYAFVYVYGQIARLAGYIRRSIADRIPSMRYLLYLTLGIIVFVLIMAYPLVEYAYWLFAQFEDYRHPRPQLPNLPFVNRIIGYFIRVYEMVIQLFADIRRKLTELYNFLRFNPFAPIRGIFDAAVFLIKLPFRVVILVYLSFAFLMNLIFGLEIEAFAFPGHNLQILVALRAIRTYFWTKVIDAVKVPGVRADLAHHRFPGFAQDLHRSLPHPQWFPYFHLLIGTCIGIFVYFTAGDHPNWRDSLLRTSDLNSTLDEVSTI
ncbi:hypothetical protein EAE96_004695 [Botrytis aclada]|nr:hypothetical protein EAE96_004695 [Botrytis aclada]